MSLSVTIEVRDATPLLATTVVFLLYIGLGWLIITGAHRIRRRLSEPLRLRRYYREALAASRERDPEENRRVAPPSGERIRMHCVWVTEVYPPSRAHSLLESVERLGFDKHWRSVSQRPLSQSLKEARGLSLTEWDHHLPPLVRNSRGHGAGALAVDLPKGVQSARGVIHTISSSLTLLVLQFLLDDETAQTLDETAKETMRSEGLDGGFPIPSLGDAKREAMYHTRARVRERCTDWVRREMPGTFAAGLNDGVPPTVQLISTEVLDPVPEHGRAAWGDFARVLGVGYWREVWRSEELSGVCVAVGDLWGHEPSTITLYAKQRRLLDLPGLAEYDKSRYGYCRLLYDRLAQIVIAWSIERVLAAYHTRLAEVRDLETAPPRPLRKAVKNLEQVRSALLRDSSDGRMVASDMLERTAALTQASRGAIELRYGEPHLASYYPDPLMTVLWEYTHKQAERLLASEQRVRETVITDSNLAGAIAGLRLQRSVFWLSLVVLLLTIATAVRQLGGCD